MKYFFVNNQKINYVPNNRSIIEYCESIGVDIPHYCYHPSLSIAGNCRMCLVEVKGSPKPVISCAMSLLNKMEIYTESPLVKKSREGVLEFLLLNHPLDCPVCDQGGECDLQDQSFIFGTSKKRFYSFKRVVTNKNIGPLVKTVMTRCIHCTRCVRFSSEIAGTEQLGVYGRGNHSEIGTYVNKVFSSELSGNVIDICPVGALTSKQYPFVGRIWELKTISSIDYCDSSATNIQLYIKSNSIVKILPGYSKHYRNNNWISDKTRFGFDGMFSPERVSNITFSSGKGSIKKTTTWLSVFNSIIDILYFQNHLSNHLFTNLKLVIVFNDNIDIESTVLLILLAKKYSFISIRKSSGKKASVDIESNFLMKGSYNPSNLSRSDLCFLFNINPRYENPDLNLKLRQRLVKGNIKVFSINSLVDLTYPVKSLGSNIDVLKNIAEGNHFICQDFTGSLNPTFLTSSEIFNRKDSKGIIDILTYLKNNTNLCSNGWDGFNVLTNYTNEVGINSLSNFKEFSINDMSNSSGVILIDQDFSSTKMKKLVELKLLNFFSIAHKEKLIVELHNIFKGQFLKSTKKNYSSSSYISLPNKIFFENGIILQKNTGVYNKTVKVLNTANLSKTNWQVLRKLKSYLPNITETNFNCSKLDLFSLNTSSNIINFIGFQYLPTSSLSGGYLKFYKTSASTTSFSPLQKSKTKLFKSKTVFWLDDFHLGGKDLYSKFSIVMAECSKSFRLESTNFNYLN